MEDFNIEQFICDICFWGGDISKTFKHALAQQGLVPTMEGKLVTKEDKVPPLKIEKGKWYVCTNNSNIYFTQNRYYECLSADSLKNDGELVEVWDSRRRPELYFRPWELNSDAKRGDMLVVAPNYILIFKHVTRVNPGNGEYGVSIFGYILNDKYYPLISSNIPSVIVKADEIRPAREEEKIKYYRIMSEEGYVWDATTKQIVFYDKESKYQTPHRQFFDFIYDRLKYHYGENPDIDYMRSLRDRIDDLFPTIGHV